MHPGNFEKQLEEIESLRSIYGDDFTMDSEDPNSYEVRIEEHKQEAFLRVTLDPGYPSLSPPRLELSAPWMDRRQKSKLIQSLNEVYLENIGQLVIYQWVEKVREVTRALKPTRKSQAAKQRKEVACKSSSSCPEIIHGEPIVDRKSIFQGHAAVVHSIDDVKAVLEKLRSNKKISNAKHNMFVYRIVSEAARGVGGSVLCDCDEDGEAHAGGRMLKLMTMLDQRNTLVVVTRWYGGIQLGPDRFRHIGNAMKQVLDQAGMVKKK